MYKHFSNDRDRFIYAFHIIFHGKFELIELLLTRRWYPEIIQRFTGLQYNAEKSTNIWIIEAAVDGEESSLCYISFE